MPKVECLPTSLLSIIVQMIEQQGTASDASPNCMDVDGQSGVVRWTSPQGNQCRVVPHVGNGSP